MTEAVRDIITPATANIGPRTRIVPTPDVARVVPAAGEGIIIVQCGLVR